MKQFHCKYCSRPMSVSYLEYQSNSYCNSCFDERAKYNKKNSSAIESFEFMGEVFQLSEPKGSNKFNNK